jgi:hypothetical protein
MASQIATTLEKATIEDFKARPSGQLAQEAAA